MKKITLNFIFCIVLFSSSLSAETIQQRFKRLEQDISDLQKELYSNKKTTTDNSLTKISNSEITVFDMRLRDIENELQSITLNYENVIFEMDEIKSSIKDLMFLIEDLNLKFSNKLISDENELLTDSSNGEDKTLGTLKINSENLSETVSSEDELLEKKVDNLSPDEKFQKAYDLLLLQNFDQAKNSLEEFIKLYPSNQLSGSAYYWLGEINLLKKNYREAALNFAEGYQKYPESIKAPDNLYKLAISLIKIDKKIEACDTLNQFVTKYPSHNNFDKTKLQIADLQCS